MNLEELEKLQKIGSIVPRVQLNIPITVEEALLICGELVTLDEIFVYIKKGKLRMLKKDGQIYINGQNLFDLLNKELYYEADQCIN